MTFRVHLNRRGFVAGAFGLGSIAATSFARRSRGQSPKTVEGKKEEDVSPAEDLMREHGLLKRILLIYEEAAARLDSGSGFAPEPTAEAAGIIRSFIEDYHEKLEEEHLFPRFRKTNRLVDLVEVLDAQHKAGRKVTELTLQLCKAEALRTPGERKRLSAALRSFIRMYAPHEAREDTVLFPALHDVFTDREYGELGERFEEREHKLFGDRGFEMMVDRVAGLEKKLQIYDLSQFTPKA